MKAIGHNGPVDDLMNAAQRTGYVIIDAAVLQQLETAAEVAEVIAAEEAYEASLNDDDRAFIATVERAVRRDNRRWSRRQWG